MLAKARLHNAALKQRAARHGAKRMLTRIQTQIRRNKSNVRADFGFVTVPAMGRKSYLNLIRRRWLFSFEAAGSLSYWLLFVTKRAAEGYRFTYKRA